MAAAPADHCYWTHTARTTPGFLSLNGTFEADVAIIGGGIVGVMAARFLKDRGRRVALIEACRVGQGVTGRSTAKVTAQHSLFLQRIEDQHGAEAARTYAAANREGVGLIGECVERHGLACDFEPADSFVYATTREGAERLELERAAAERAGLPMAIVDDLDLPYPVTAALRLSDQAQFQPVDFVAQLAATIPGEGSHVFERTRAVDWSQTEVTTEHGTIRASQVIMATHLPLGQVGMFHAHNKPHMHAVLAVPVEAARAPEGMYISTDQPKRSIRRHRSSSGGDHLILAGPTFKHGDAEGERSAFAELESFAREQFGYSGGGYRWSNEDYSPRDGLPYVGWSGGLKSLLVAVGFDAWGLSNGAVAARILADLVEDRSSPASELFDASRHSLKGATELAKNMAKVTHDLVSGYLRSPKDLAEASEGDLVKTDQGAAGLYRAENGSFRAVSITCTHMGCRLGWNPVDRTWDCPCHGSRFAADGAVLHGPAVTALEPVDLAGKA